MHSILVIEDDLYIRNSLQEAFESEGYFVFTAENGADALALLMRIKPPTVILLDWQMPLMTGEDFLKARSREEVLASIPVIIVSAVSEKVKKSHNVVDVIKKPFNLDDLLSKVRTCCDEVAEN
jgi:DNA-binding response OmpR family regulator